MQCFTSSCDCQGPFLSLQVVMWLNQNFLLRDEIEGKDAELDMMFLSLRTGNPLTIKMDPSGNVRIMMVQFHACVLFIYKV